MAELLTGRGAEVVIGDQSGIEHVLHQPGGVLRGRTALGDRAHFDETNKITGNTSSSHEGDASAAGAEPPGASGFSKDFSKADSLQSLKSDLNFVCPN